MPLKGSTAVGDYKMGTDVLADAAHDDRRRQCAGAVGQPLDPGTGARGGGPRVAWRGASSEASRTETILISDDPRPDFIRPDKSEPQAH